MILWLILLLPLAFVVARWAWRYQLQLLAVAGKGLANLAGQPGTVTDIILTSVLADEGTAIISFRPAGQPPHRSVAPPRSLLVLLDHDAMATAARLRRWEASGAQVVLYRDPDGGHAELSSARGPKISVCVLPAPSPTRDRLRPPARGRLS